AHLVHLPAGLPGLQHRDSLGRLHRTLHHPGDAPSDPEPLRTQKNGGDVAMEERVLRVYIGRAVSYALLLLVALLFVIPVFWMLSGSLKTRGEIYTFPPQWIPLHPKFSNYVEAWHAAPFGRYYLNTVIVAFFGTAIEMVDAVLVAYALVFLRFPGKNL